MPESSSLSLHFAHLTDPRIERCQRHSLHDILLLSICALLCGAESFVEMEEFGEAQQHWLRELLELPNGIPSHDTFGRVFAMLDPEQFAEAFSAWTQSLRRALPGEVVALDGKTLRRSGGGGRSPVHLVSAWAADNRLVLGQLRTAEKSNEITAVPELLRRLELAGCPSAPLRALSLSKRHRHPRRDGLPESDCPRDQRGGRRLRARPQSQPRHPAWRDQNLPR